MKRRGYTLVELLVVIAIVAILAAMIAPVLLQAKESARMRVCASNMHQLGIAISNYMDDHQGFGLPPPPAMRYRNWWILCIEPLIPRYIPGSLKDLERELPTLNTSTIVRILPQQQPKHIWICPGDVSRGTKSIEEPYWYVRGSSYLYPGPTAYMSGNNIEDRKNIVARKPMAWRNHRRDILLADYWFDFHTGRRVEHQFDTIMPPPWVSVLDVKGLNVLFLDQHVKACSAAERQDYVNNTRGIDNPDFKGTPTP